MIFGKEYEHLNILYISFLNGDSWAGPTYSVPKQIEAQSEIDNVFWYNVRENIVECWKNTPYYHDLSDYPTQRILNLPAPFNKPDIIIVEQFYGYAGEKILTSIKQTNIPYVIIPRGELTASAQKRKKWKKKIANVLFFYQFAARAAAIEYLTDQEKKDSGERWNRTSIVIPNGIKKPDITKDEYCKIGIKCIGIGRMEPYHKGIDMLIEACGLISVDIRKRGCIIDLYGPDYDGKKEELIERINELEIQDFFQIHEGVYGEDKRNKLLESDVFLLTSRFEGHPMALIEALSFGLPCVVTRGSNMKERIEQNNAGWTAENNIESIRDALLNMLNDITSIQKKGKNAIELAQNYGWNEIALSTHEEYLKIIGK